VLGISQKRISFAGTKDKRALTVQHFSIYGVKAEEVEEVKLKDAKIEVLGYANRSIQLGDLLGNFFRIRVHGGENGELFNSTLDELEEKGTPNFFGLQRFGSIRYITHEVGKLILQGNYEEAFWVYVAKPFEGEKEEVRKVRELLWSSRDPKLGLKELPKHLRYERSLLQKLREGKSEEEALLSYIFNRLLSERIKQFGELKSVQDGDAACYLTFKTRPTFADCSKISANRLRVERLIRERVASLALPLVGYDTKPEGWCRIAIEFLNEDNLDFVSFKTEHKEFSSSGSYRPADMLIEHTEIAFDGESFTFYLPGGCYATIMLREFLKRELS
jgi:tRNA pseudouridine13 synthase